MKLKTNNLILIVGNGFDLAHGFKTSFADFAKYLLREKIAKTIINFDRKNFDSNNNYNDPFIKDHLFRLLANNVILNLNGDLKERLAHFKDINDLEGMIDTLFHKKDEISSILKSTFLGNLFENKYENWFDIEDAYYSEILSIYKKKWPNHEAARQAQVLNQHLSEIKLLFVEYLKTLKTNKDRYISDFFKIKQLRDLTNLYVVNFNYTLTIENYIGNDDKTKINYIHGDLHSKDIIFGYGNNLHNEYQAIKDSNINEYLKYFKTFEYLKTGKYLGIYEDALENFVEYDVAILGHSLAPTDKTLLQEIMDNPKCKRIHLFKRKDLSKDEGNLKEEFNKLVFAASRIINNERDLRKKVLNYEESTFFPK